MIDPVSCFVVAACVGAYAGTLFKKHENQQAKKAKVGFDRAWYSGQHPDFVYQGTVRCFDCGLGKQTRCPYEVERRGRKVVIPEITEVCCASCGTVLFYRDDSSH